MANVSLSQRDVDLISRVVDTEVPRSIQRRDPVTYDKMVRAVVDTVTNRVASPSFPNTVAGVLNQDRAFSKIAGPSRLNPYGSAQKAPQAPKSVMDIVSSHITQRAQGLPSSIGASTHYANPNYSDRKNLMGWINPMIEAGAQRLGLGKAVHYHGTPPGQTPAPEYGIALDDAFDVGPALAGTFPSAPPTPTAAPRNETFAAPLSAVARAPLDAPSAPREVSFSGMTPANAYSPADTFSQVAEVDAAVAANPESYTPEETAMVDAARLSPPGVLGQFATPGARMAPNAPSVLGLGALTPALSQALTAPAPAPAPVAAPALAPPKNVDTYSVASTTPSAPPSVPTGMDFWTGKADWGVASNGTVLGTDAYGRTMSTSPKSGITTVELDNGLTARQIGSPSIDVTPPNIGLPSRDRLGRMGKQAAYAGGLGVLGSMLGGPVVGLLGAQVGKNLAQGKGMFGQGGQLGKLAKQARAARTAPMAGFVSGGAFPSAPSAPPGGGAGGGYSQADIDRARGLSPGLADAMGRGAVGLW